jgi:hypothetical protein
MTARTNIAMLLTYVDYYKGTRTHLSLNKDAPISRPVEAAGRILCRPILGGPHRHGNPKPQETGLQLTPGFLAKSD